MLLCRQDCLMESILLVIRDYLPSLVEKVMLIGGL